MEDLKFYDKQELTGFLSVKDENISDVAMALRIDNFVIIEMKRGN